MYLEECSHIFCPRVIVRVLEPVCTKAISILEDKI